MDEELAALEAELKRLQPVRPSARLLGELQRRLGRRQSVRLWPMGWLALPAAATVTFLLIRAPSANEQTANVAASSTTPASMAARPFKPIAAQNVLLAERDDGVFTLEDGSHARRIRQSYVDKIVWENPSTHASLTWTVPREEVRVVPVSFQ